ncbi:hypothetical protein HK104_008097 [Borealophlyctis nickersoniae]|nr:hypothetical protein HK104_008097 [Borealophlyctis nickersoniae]
MTNTAETDDMNTGNDKPSANASSASQNTAPVNTDPASPPDNHSGGAEDASGQGQGNDGGAGKKRNVRETGDEERGGIEEGVAEGDRTTTKLSKKQKIDGEGGQTEAQEAQDYGDADEEDEEGSSNISTVSLHVKRTA